MKRTNNKFVKMPSTLNFFNSPNKYFLDFNSIFWKYIFSKDFIENLFNEYSSKVKISNDMEIYFNYILNNLDEINKICMNSFIYPYEEQRLLYCFKMYYFVISIFNSINTEYRLTLAYGIYSNFSTKNIEKSISKENNFLNIFFNNYINNNTFFKDNYNYIISVYWENELHIVLTLSNLLKKKFSNIKIIIDLNNVNEQADFSFWLNNDIIKNYIDDFSNIYYKENKKKSSLKNVSEFKRYNLKSLSIRLFDTKCFWNKCSFCVINSRFKSDKITDSLNDKSKKRVDEIINYCRNFNTSLYITFTDEAVECSILLYFAEQLLKNKIKVIWSARSRFSKKYTFETCKILGKSGLRFLGFGLESANKRITKLMNKREENLSKEDLNEILKNCDENNINPHTYLIVGFPSETKKETDETVKFIEFNLQKRRYFTYSANRFTLMKGSDVYNNPEKFGIEIDDKNESEKLSNINFIDNNPGEKYTKNELSSITNKLYSKMFFKDADDKNFRVFNGYQFWDFLDRTGIFYSQKFLYSYNPYLKNIIKSEINNELLNSKFKLIPITLIKRKNKLYFHNIIMEKLTYIEKSIEQLFKIFIKIFNPDLTLKENINNSFSELSIKITEKQQKTFNKALIELINDSLLYKNILTIKDDYFHLL